ncbi:MAG: branched-chain amino acid ABC transporter permease [Geovibrio sp.]|uniref:branched-chain amino acid ABC transporter permease n=1 Tax=Geovibrio ferrireducens TaxID=46201 RepID=UPI00224521E5|nr:branched-chain amino acid ABC transporter permease [Geovibrio ferrireducens]MCD8567353.1 branched-chain amino acid ABC transporter permease [Geovibrio sp.]
MKFLLNQKPSNIGITLAIIALLFAVPVFVSSPSVMQILILIIFYAYLTSCWNFVGGFAGVLPLGHSAFVGIGAYTSTTLYLTYGLSPWIGMFAGGVVAALMGILIGLPTLKLRGAYFALATIAFGEGLRVFVENVEKIGPLEIRGPKGLLINLTESSFVHFQFMSKVPYYYIILVMLLLVLLLTYIMMNSKIGYYLAAGGEEKDAAEALGIKVSRYKLIAMIISCFLTALGGTFYAQLMLYFYPKSVLGLELSYEIAFIALIGGRGTIMGPVLGALLLRPVNELTRIYLSDSLPGLHLIIFGLILIIVMRYQPRGLVEPVSRWIGMLKDRFASKEKPAVKNGEAVTD